MCSEINLLWLNSGIIVLGQRPKHWDFYYYFLGIVYAI